MIHNLLDPVIMFFLVGIIARLLNVGLSIPTYIYDTISVYLLLAIGLKGGFEFSQMQDFSIFLPSVGALCVGIFAPCIAFLIGYKWKKMCREDAVVLAAHYGAASAVTFAVALNYLEDNGYGYERYFTLILVIIEVIGILVSFSFLHLNPSGWRQSLKKILHDVLLNKSIFLLIVGVLIGWISSVQGFGHVKILFIDLFKGILCFFMLEMGLVCGQQLAKIRENARFIFLFGIGMPLIASTFAIFIGKATGLSVEGTTILATIAASASYIAAPAVARSVLPHAQLSIPLASALGVTFPFNVIFGIPLYHFLAGFFFSLVA